MNFQWVILFWLALLLECAQCRHSSHVLAFAGGGFGSPANKKSKSKKKRKQRSALTEMEAPPPKQEQEKELDKWGLPVLTDEELFPAMPEGTELIAASSSEPSSIDEIKDALKEHLCLDLSNFDSNGVERSPSPGNEPMKLHLLHKSPPVLGIDNFFTAQECDETKLVAIGDVDDSNAPLQVGSATFSPLAQSKRTSTSWFCHYSQMPTLLSKASHRLGIPLAQMEEPQIVRYRTGEEFSYHYDEVPPTQLDNGGQRVATLLVYLNTVNRGGGTMFRDLQSPKQERLTVQPVQGRALLFFPAYGDGRPDDRTLHKGQMAEDEKWITQMWIHQHAYTPVVPRGNKHKAAHDAIEKVSRNLGYIE